MQLVWIDLETTGLNPLEDHILEVAVSLATLGDPFNVTNGFSPRHGDAAWRNRPVAWVIHKEPADTDCAKSLRFPKNMHPKVVEMHTKNGLFAACAASSFSLGDVEARLLELIPEGPPSDDPNDPNANKPVLAGNTVHFDLGFVRTWMPTLAKRLSHRVYDVSAISLFCRSLGMPRMPKEDPPHRASEDVINSIRQAKICADWLLYLEDVSKLHAIRIATAP